MKRTDTASLRKRPLLGLLALFSAGILLSSCEKLDEVPPELNSMNDLKLNLPDAEPLNEEDAALIGDLKDRYLNAIN